MSILADYHMHSSFSGDSEVPMESMICSGIAKGLKHMCFTEHLDFHVTPDFPKVRFPIDMEAYQTESRRCKEQK